MMEMMGWICGGIAVGGVVLNNYRMRSCFWLWMISNALSACLHAHAGIWSLAVRDVIFFVLAAQGFWLWGKKKL